MICPISQINNQFRKQINKLTFDNILQQHIAGPYDQRRSTKKGRVTGTYMRSSLVYTEKIQVAT
jgi:hypothetical protein